MAINQTLKKLGLNEKEIKVYTALLKRGKIKPSSLAALTKISRPTVYNLIKSLVAKGLVAEDLSGTALFVVPLPLDNLKKILDQPKREIAEKEDLVKKAIGELSLLVPDEKYPVPKIRFVEEGNIENFLFDTLVKWQRSVLKSGGAWWGFQDYNFVETYRKWTKKTWETEESKNENYRARIFTNSLEIKRETRARYPGIRMKRRYFDDTDFTASIFVAGEYLIMINTRQKPFYLFEIHDEALAHNMRQILKKMWMLSEKHNTQSPQH